MIIYKAQQNRHYPIVVKSLSRKYCNVYNYRSIFRISNSNEEELGFNKNILLYPPKQKLIRTKKDINFISYYYREAIPRKNSNQDIDFIHGIFPLEDLENFNHDFSFTFLEHPVNNVYHLFNYIQYIKNHGLKKFESLDSYNSAVKSREEIGTQTIFQKFSSYSKIEEFIDEFLYTKGFVKFKYENIEFSFINDFFKVDWAKNLDFIGLVNNEINFFKSIDLLHKKLHLEKLDMDDYKPDSDLITNQNYRSKEIYDLFSKDIEFFNNREIELQNE